MDQHIYDISRKTVLCVVEDLDTCLRLDRMMFRHYPNQKLICTRNCIDALVSIKNCKPDIFIIDMNLPFFDWVLLSGEILSLDKGSDTIGLSDRVNNELAERCRNAGIKNYLTKPINFEILFSKIDAMMEEIFVKRLHAAKFNASLQIKLTVIK
jgi:DNA-binding response OmpR family regulator